MSVVIFIASKGRELLLDGRLLWELQMLDKGKWKKNMFVDFFFFFFFSTNSSEPWYFSKFVSLCNFACTQLFTPSDLR